MKNILDYLTWEHVEVGVRIIGCDKSFEGALEVPVLIDGRQVVGIGSWAFYFCSGLDELHLGAGIKKIEDHAFSCCCSLKSVKIPDSVEVVGKSAFEDCAGLEELHLGAGIKKIEDYAFTGCFSLRRVVLPSTLVALVRGAFYERVDLVVDDDI